MSDRPDTCLIAQKKYEGSLDVMFQTIYGRCATTDVFDLKRLLVWETQLLHRWAELP